MGKYPAKTYQIESLNRYFTEPSSPHAPFTVPTKSKKIRKNIDQQLLIRQRKLARREKSPGLAAWFSSLFWGGGQIYADSLVIGLYFFFVQILWVSALVMTHFHAQAIHTLWQGMQMSDASLLFLGTFFSLIMSLFWMGNIFHAYRNVHKYRRYVYEGTDSLLMMILGSFWLPGMGQVLNGQTKKGYLFMLAPFLFSIFLFASIWTLNFWPVLQDMNALLFGEFLITAAIVLFAASFLIGLWAHYDAIKVNLYPGKRDSILRRLKFSWNRFKKESFFYKLKSIPRFCMAHLIVILLFGITLHAAWQFFPDRFYSQNLSRASQFMKDQRMIILPPVMERSALLAKEVEELPKPMKAYFASN